jgi:hypothetical protein
MRAIAVLIRAAGWPAIIGLTLCAALVGGCALTFAGAVGTAAPLDAALALLAAAGGFALEEPAAAVVDLTPTRSVQLTAARAVALLPPLLTGCALALFATHSSGPPALDLSVTLLGSSILGFTLVGAQLGLLFWETRYVSMTLGAPGLRPRKTVPTGEE